MTVLQLISSEGYYGAENMLVSLARFLERLDCHNVVGVFYNSQRPHIEVAEQAKAWGLKVETLPCHGKADWNVVPRIINCVRGRRVDLIHTHGYKANFYGYLAARHLGMPLVATCHNWPGRSLALRFYAALDRLVLKQFRKIVAVSESVAALLQRAGVSPVKIATIDNGVDLKRFEAAHPTVAEELQKGSRPLIGMVARLEWEKGPAHLLHAARRVLTAFPEALFVLIGDGPAQAELRELARQLGIDTNVVFLGARSDMPQVYASLDLFVLPSLNEGTPMTVLEAMAAGTPVIATSVGAIPRLILHEKTGLLVQPADSTSLAAAILRLLGDRDLRTSLATAARNHVCKQFSAEHMARRYLDIYCDIVQETRAH